MSKRKLYRLAILFITGLVLAISIQTPAQERPKPIDVPVTTSTNALVPHVVDGDTIDVVMDSGDEATIRLLGVNTPETVDPRRPVECFGKEASNFMKQLVEGKRIRLESDPQADDVDKYGRLLRNIVLQDGTDVNASLVRDGYAYAYTSFPLDVNRKAELLRLEQEARLAGRGLWNAETCAGVK